MRTNPNNHWTSLTIPALQSWFQTFVRAHRPTMQWYNRTCAHGKTNVPWMDTYLAEKASSSNVGVLSPTQSFVLSACTLVHMLQYITLFHFIPVLLYSRIISICSQSWFNPWEGKERKTYISYDSISGYLYALMLHVAVMFTILRISGIHELLKELFA